MCRTDAYKLAPSRFQPQLAINLFLFIPLLLFNTFSSPRPWIIVNGALHTHTQMYLYIHSSRALSLSLSFISPSVCLSLVLFL